MMTTKFRAVAYAFAVLAGSAFGQDTHYFGYHPMSVMTLGAGFSKKDLTAAKLRALDYSVTPAEGGALSTSLTTLLVTNSTQLKQALNLDLSVDASYLAFSGGAKYSYNDNSLFTSDSATVVISAFTEFGRLTLKGAKLTSDAKAFIDANRMTDFESTYGSDVVVMERRGASVSIILTIADISASEKSKITAEANASGGWGALSGSARMSFQHELERAAKDGSLTVQVVATGGQGFSGLADLVKTLSSSPDSLHAIQDALAAFLKQFDTTNSAPIGFHTLSMEAFGWRPPEKNEDIWNDRKLSKLLILVDDYRATQHSVARAKAILSGVDPIAVTLTTPQIAAIKEAATKYDQRLDVLAVTHAKCKASSDLSLCTAPVVEVASDPIPAAPVTKLCRDDSRLDNTTRLQRDVGQCRCAGFVFRNAFANEIVLRVNDIVMSSDQFDGKSSETTFVVNESSWSKAEAFARNQYSAGNRSGSAKLSLTLRDAFGRTQRFTIGELKWAKWLEYPGGDVPQFIASTYTVEPCGDR